MKRRAFLSRAHLGPSLCPKLKGLAFSQDRLERKVAKKLSEPGAHSRTSNSGLKLGRSLRYSPGFSMGVPDSVCICFL